MLFSRSQATPAPANKEAPPNCVFLVPSPSFSLELTNLRQGQARALHQFFCESSLSWQIPMVQGLAFRWSLRTKSETGITHGSSRKDNSNHALTASLAVANTHSVSHNHPLRFGPTW